MPASSRRLAGALSPPTPHQSLKYYAPPPHQSSKNYISPPNMETLNSDFVVILTALLCALICVLGLLVVARCAWIRRMGSAHQSSAAAANRGLKKKVLNSLPKLTYGGEDQSAKLSDCAICLSEFAAGDEIRVLPQCGHGFHVSCIDTWLGSHSSCPSCRQVLGAARCQKCGDLPAPAACSPAGGQVSPP